MGDLPIDEGRGGRLGPELLIGPGGGPQNDCGNEEREDALEFAEVLEVHEEDLTHEQTEEAQGRPAEPGAAEGKAEGEHDPGIDPPEHRQGHLAATTPGDRVA